MRSLAPYGVIPVFLVVMEIIFIRTEEQMLAAKFGTDWIEYKKTTRRWL
jgi:protein-S-isoprenylcysteine O-methyltransferase Ste14